MDNLINDEILGKLKDDGKSGKQLTSICHYFVRCFKEEDIEE